jgi:hypothetical protein
VRRSGDGSMALVEAKIFSLLTKRGSLFPI